VRSERVKSGPASRQIYGDDDDEKYNKNVNIAKGGAVKQKHLLLGKIILFHEGSRLLSSHCCKQQEEGFV